MDAILVRDVTKTYRVGVGRARVREMLPWPVDRAVGTVFPRWWRKNTFNALDGVSATIPAGSSVGIVGHNGAGKTTLLKVIASVTAPNRGTVRVSGRIAALLDALVGFHPDLTGRENVHLLGAMHGFRRRLMNDRMDRILEFAEIHELIDTPLKRFSAGMSARLGFAVLTALDVDILLVDEILAVGDAAFQRKSLRWLDEYRERGGTLLFVSHNLSLVRSMTERAIWLDHGKVMADGPTGDVLAQYVQAMERRQAGPSVHWVGRHRQRDLRQLMARQAQDRWGAGGARVSEAHVEEPHGPNEGLEVLINYEASELDRAVFCVGFVDEAGREIGAAASPPLPVNGQGGAVRCAIRPLPLRTGIYFPVVAILSPDGRVRDRWKLDRAVVVDRDGEAGLVDAFGPVDIASHWSGDPRGGGR